MRATTPITIIINCQCTSLRKIFIAANEHITNDFFGTFNVVLLGWFCMTLVKVNVGNDKITTLSSTTTTAKNRMGTRSYILILVRPRVRAFAMKNWILWERKKFKRNETYSKLRHHIVRVDVTNWNIETARARIEKTRKMYSHVVFIVSVAKESIEYGNFRSVPTQRQ